MNLTTPETLIGEPLPDKSFSIFLNGEAYVRETDMNWASYQIGFVAPISFVGNPMIKYGDKITYDIGFGYYPNPDQMAPQVMSLQSTQSVANGAVVGSRGSASIFLNSAVTLTLSGVALAATLLSF